MTATARAEAGAGAACTDELGDETVLVTMLAFQSAAVAPPSTFTVAPLR